MAKRKIDKSVEKQTLASSEMLTPPSGIPAIEPVEPTRNRTRRFISWTWKNRRKRPVQLGAGCGSLTLICSLCLVFSFIGQTLGFIPDATERAQTAQPNQAAAFNVTRNAQLTATFNARPTEEISTDTPIPSATDNLTATFAVLTLLATDVDTNTPAPTNTIIPPTDVPTIAPTINAQSGVVTPVNPTQTYYTLGAANLRSCAETTCEAIVQLTGGTAVTINGMIVGEQVRQGNGLWYRLDYNGRAAYVYSDLLTSTLPQVSAPAGTTNLPVVQQWDCSINYNCPNFNDRATLMSYWNACPGDPSGLDGNPANGVPCESIGR